MDKFLKNSILMKQLCLVCTSEDDKLKLIDFLEALFKVPDVIIDKILSSDIVPSIKRWKLKTEPMTLKDEFELLTYIVNLPYYEQFIKTYLLHVIFDKIYGLNEQKEYLVDFVKSWKLPSNAYKFINYNSSLEYNMFMLAIKQPYDNKITVHDILNNAHESSCKSWTELRCNSFGEPEM